MTLSRNTIALLLCLASATAGAAEPLANNADARLKRMLERTAAQSSGEALPDEARQQMLAAGEAALSRGDADQAAMHFERAGMVKHEADAELGLIRAYMQAGEYRRALAFAAHTAGAHPATGAGSALYAWLLHIGGQAQVAALLLDKARARLPHDALLQATTSLIRTPQAAPAAELSVPPARFAPYSPESVMLPPSAAVIASGVLIDGGRSVLTSTAALGNAREAWVRNGLGQVAAATVSRAIDDAGLTRLHLTRSMNVAEPVLPPRDPFPGSPGFAVAFPHAANATAGWPILHVGFLGKPTSVAGVYQLGVAMPHSNRGGPVFDAGGRLIGIIVADAASDERLMLASHLRKFIADAPAENSQTPAAAAERIAVDEIYERALKITVQVIAVP